MAKTLEVFEKRNKNKQHIHFADEKNFFVNKKQVRYVHTGINIGCETDGKGDDAKRVALVLAKAGNMFLVANMKTKGKDNHKFYYKLDTSYFNIDSYVMLSQIKTVDKKRFIEQIGEISGEDFAKIKKEIQKLFF